MVLLLKGKTLTLHNQKQNFSTGFDLFSERTTNFYTFSYYFCHKSIELDCRTPRGRQRASGTERRRSQRKRIFAVSKGCTSQSFAALSSLLSAQAGPGGAGGLRRRPEEANARPSRSTGPRREEGSRQRAASGLSSHSVRGPVLFLALCQTNINFTSKSRRVYR